MRHTIHIMFGKNSQSIIQKINEYVVKYGSEEENAFFSAFIYDEKKTGYATFDLVEQVIPSSKTFIPNIDNLYVSTTRELYRIPDESRKVYLQDSFSRMFNSRVTIDNPGDSNTLYITIYVPLYNLAYWNVTKEFLEAIRLVNRNINIDLCLISSDLSYLFTDNNDSTVSLKEDYVTVSKSVLKEIVEYKKTHFVISNLMMFQNYNTEGASLNLTPTAFARIIGEYSLLLISHYHALYNPSSINISKPIYSLGLTVLDFDRYSFVQYLLHKAYLAILDREGIQEDEVSVNKVSKTVQEILEKNVNIYTSFFEKYISPLIAKGEKEENIISKIDDDLSVEFQQLAECFQSFIDNPKMSLPEKKATLAQLLGEDDSLLVGYMFNKQQLVIDDCSREILDLFISLNNKLISYVDRSVSDSVENKPSNSLIDYAALSSHDKEEVKLASDVLDELKSIKVSMRESSNYIRLKTEELNGIAEQIDENIDSRKRLTKDGFVFDGRLYQLQSHPESKLDKDYVPTKDQLPKEIDLREHFTTIKDQGQIGACSAFSVIGIYEYILKRNKYQERDLSERFVYFNVRKKMNQLNNDSGSSLYDTITSVMEMGVCIESLCPYGEELAKEPDASAYADAQKHKVLSALNVNIKLEDLKSALYEGYPVAISLKIYESFSPKLGFVSRPTSEDLEKESGNHAMILCGYSDDKKIFIVRNSWGMTFGDNGYCYIPYSYVANPQFLNSASIIEKVSDENTSLILTEKKTTVDFDMSNSKIKTLVLTNLIEEEKIDLKRNSEKYDAKTLEYNMLFQTLGNNPIREAIYEGTKKRFILEKKALEKAKKDKQNEREDVLKNFDYNTKLASFIFSAFIMLLFLLFGILGKVLGFQTVFCNYVSYVIYAFVAVVVVIFFLWYQKRHHDRTCLAKEYEVALNLIVDQISEKDTEINAIHLKTHVAGMIIDKFALLLKQMHSKYNGMRSYVGNLKVWRKEEGERKLEDFPSTQTSSLSLLSKDRLDNYFEDNNSICNQVNLYSMFKNKYQISEEQIVSFKNELKNTLVNSLFDSVSDFSIFKYLMGMEKYEYVQPLDSLNDLLQKMDNMSYLFINKCNTSNLDSSQCDTSKFLILESFNEADRDDLQKLISKSFCELPQLLQGNSRYKISLVQIGCLGLQDIALLK